MSSKFALTLWSIDWIAQKCGVTSEQILADNVASWPLESQRQLKLLLQLGEAKRISIAEMFPDFERGDKFPLDECRTPMPNRAELRQSENFYLCILMDSRWPDRISLRALRPYVFEGILHEGDTDAQQLFAWISGDEVFTHLRDVELVDTPEKVIAWKFLGPTGVNFLNYHGKL